MIHDNLSFEHFVKLKTNHNNHKFSSFLSFLNQAKQALKDNPLFSIVESKNFTIMAESNGCLTFQFFTEFKNQTSLEDAANTIKNEFQKSYSVTADNGETVSVTTDMNNTEYTIFDTEPSTVLTFAKEDNKPFIQYESDVPANTTFIEVKGLLGESASDNTKLFIYFLDSDRQKLSFSGETPKWINQFKNEFNSRFTPNDQMFIHYKYVIKLLTGKTKESFEVNGKSIAFVNERSRFKLGGDKSLIDNEINMIFFDERESGFY